MHMHNFYQQSSCMCAGLVGISLTADWGEPVDISNQRDIEAAERYIQFYLGWFATPLFHGDYPQVMKDYIGMSNATIYTFAICKNVLTPKKKKDITTCVKNFQGKFNVHPFQREKSHHVIHLFS